VYGCVSADFYNFLPLVRVCICRAGKLVHHHRTPPWSVQPNHTLFHMEENGCGAYASQVLYAWSTYLHTAHATRYILYTILYYTRIRTSVRSTQQLLTCADSCKVNTELVIAHIVDIWIPALMDSIACSITANLEYLSSSAYIDTVYS
jgi:hypothetical protein